MLDIGFLEIGVVAVVALIVIGPDKLPSVVRRTGKLIHQWRTLWANVCRQTEDIMDNPTNSSSDDTKSKSKSSQQKE